MIKMVNGIDMKKYLKSLFIFFFCINSPNYLYANIDNIFGIKLFDNVSKYSKISKGKTRDYLPKNIYTFSDKDLNNIDRDPIFDNYYLRSNDRYKIINITGKKNFFVQKNNFKNDCTPLKNEFISKLSNAIDIDPITFKSYYSKNNTSSKTKLLWDSSIYEYKDNGKKFVLATYCSYMNWQDKFYSSLHVSWLSHDYYKKYVLTRVTQIKKFDDKFILNYLFN